MSLLHMAAMNDKPEAAGLLLDRGVEVDTKKNVVL